MSSSAKIRYSYDIGEDRLGKKGYPVEASMKKLINDEMTQKPNGRQNVPSIVARLMGMDVLPLETKSTIYPMKKRDEIIGNKFPNNGKNANGSFAHTFSNSNRRHEVDPIYCHKDRDPDIWSTRHKVEKPKRREHPQEEELQKFKKEFEAWQAARFKECSRFAEADCTSTSRVHCNVPVHANHGKVAREWPMELKSSSAKPKSLERGHLCRYGDKPHLYPAEKEPLLISRATGRELKRLGGTVSGVKVDHHDVPTTIVVLKPGPDRIWSSEDSWTTFSGSSEERGSIEDFLEEVKERLKHELQGKILHRGSIVKGSVTQASFGENPTEPQKIAQQIAKQVRESVSRDLGVDLIRSESTRSHRSEVQMNELSSPEFINRDTRRFLAERLRNVLKRDSEFHMPMDVNDPSRSYNLGKERIGMKHHHHASYSEIVNYGEEEEMQARSFRHGSEETRFHQEMSPKNLIRSLSAPVSGTSFGKLLLEDRHVVTGAHIRRNHESIENLLADVKKGRKERFSFREKVHNFRSTFTLRGKLFGRRMQSMEELCTSEPSFMKDIMSGPTVISNPSERYENSTEVPPSPASVCSSVQEEFWRPSNDLSPLSSPDTTPSEKVDALQDFGEINSTMSESQMVLNQPDSNGTVPTTTALEPIESKISNVEDEAATFIRDLLVASGIYDGSSEMCLSRCDSLAKPINDLVFEEVEQSYREQAKESNHLAKDANENGVLDHKVLHDLLNEALSVVLGPPVILPRFHTKVSSSYFWPHHRGQKLFECVWEFVRAYIYPQLGPSNYLLDGTGDFELALWSKLLDDQTDALVGEMEGLILEDIIEETVKGVESR